MNSSTGCRSISQYVYLSTVVPDVVEFLNTYIYLQWYRMWQYFSICIFIYSGTGCGSISQYVYLSTVVSDVAVFLNMYIYLQW